MLAAGEAVVFNRSSFGFGLSAGGDRIVLTRSGGSNTASSLEFDVQRADVSQGRYPNGYPSFAYYPGGGSPGV